jgi:rifampicin phosphotransferase
MQINPYVVKYRVRSLQPALPRRGLTWVFDVGVVYEVIYNVSHVGRQEGEIKHMSSAPFVWSFGAAEPELALLGGKGANLVRLTQAGFEVPPGFCVTTEAYREAVSGGLRDRIVSLVQAADYGDPEALESSTAEIRKLIEAAEVPASLHGELAAAYAALGDEPFVAVRSSGTAEDLADASFAGLHDTYLDIRGVDAVLDAVKRCWASLWTARAAAYRQSKGFDHGEVALSVVVQVMVASEVSGVMFTGNPMNAATDEVVINASWGLGEAIVSGIVTPDEFTLKATSLNVLERTVGEKAQRIDRAAETGTVISEVPSADRARPTLSEEEIRRLARLGLRVQKHYGGLPQDIEWALAAGRFYVLQSRPVTGVEFSWDAEVTPTPNYPEDDEVIWTKAGADEWWTGAVSPLMFSYRAGLWQRAHEQLVEVMGLQPRMRFWKFHRSEAYFNTALQRQLVERACPPPFRPAMLAQLPPDAREVALAAPFSYLDHAKSYLKMELAFPTRSWTRWIKSFQRLVVHEQARGRALLAIDVQELSDDELMHHIEDCIEYEYTYYPELWIPFWIIGRDMASLLAGLVAEWYDGENEFAAVELMSGVPERTITQIENYELWELAQEIRNSAELRERFEAHQGADFLESLERSDAGLAYLARYRDYVERFGHRGSADRDLYFHKRAEDPMIDYRSLQALLSAKEAVDPAVKEEEINARRDQVLSEVIENVRTRPLGFIRAEIIKVVHAHVMGFLMARDNERELADFGTYSVKLAFKEVSRRLIEREILETERDFFFLTKQELYALLDGDLRNLDLTRAKIAARARNFDDYRSRKAQIPAYIYRNKPLDFAALDVAGEDGTLVGAGTSRGTVTGKARVLHGPEELGRVRHGEIVVCHATDPGWTPVFMVISGLVLETGGVLAHGSCLSREYGLPCVQVARATELIQDGSTITINGDSGVVVVEQPSSTAPDEPELATA